MINYNTVSEKIFGILKGFGFSVKLYDNKGNETVNPSDASYFYVNRPNMMVSVNKDNNEIQVSKSETLDVEDFKPILKRFRNLGNHYMLNVQTRVFGKEIKPKDFAYKTVKDTSMPSITEASLSKLAGSKKSSHQQLESVKILIKHKKPVDENVRGSRTRNISAIFLEQNGERLRYPFVHLTGARAMARHMYNGGSMTDVLGQHILECSKNAGSLKSFLNYARSNKLITEDNNEVIGVVRESLDVLTNDLKRLAGSKTYGVASSRIYEQLASKMDEQLDEENVNKLKELFTVKKFDEAMATILPLVSKLIKEKTDTNRVIETEVDEVEINEGISYVLPLEFANKAEQLSFNINYLSETVKNEKLSAFLKKISKTIAENKKLSGFEESVVKQVMEKVSEKKKKDEEKSEKSELKECIDFERSLNKYTRLF